MKRVTRYVTLDGAEHKDAGAAERHLDALYICVRQGIWNGLANAVSERVRLMEWVDENLDKFVQLKDIRQDMVVPPDED